MRTVHPITYRPTVRPRSPQVRLASAAAAAAAVERLEGRRLLSTVPNDPSYAEQWGLADANASAAWDAGTGSATVLVGHIDTGIDYTHVDLYKNVWINQAEIPRAVKRKLVDVDGDKRISFYDLNDAANAGRVADVNANGYVDAGDLLNPYKADGSGGWEDGKNGKNNKRDAYVDDIVGWDFAGNDNDPMDADAGSHGTHTAGTIAAEGNNGVGVAGVVWKASLMALKVFADGGDGADDAAVAAAIRYAADYGARVTNNSYGGAGGAAGGVIYDALVYADANGVISVFAAGNDGVDNDNSPLASYPASYTLDTIVSVAASDSTGRVTSWSNYGATTVDLAAPGDAILSTVRGNAYATTSGTSMAAPFVTGTVALILSQNPDLTAAEVKSRLLTGADEQAAAADRTAQPTRAFAGPGGWGFAGRNPGDTATDATLNDANAVQGVAGEQVADAPADDGTADDGSTPTDPAAPAYAFPWFGFGWSYGTAFGRVPVDYGSAQSWSVVAAADGCGWRFVG